MPAGRLQDFFTAAALPGQFSGLRSPRRRRSYARRRQCCADPPSCSRCTVGALYATFLRARQRKSRVPVRAFPALPGAHGGECGGTSQDKTGEAPRLLPTGISCVAIQGAERSRIACRKDGHIPQQLVHLPRRPPRPPIGACARINERLTAPKDGMFSSSISDQRAPFRGEMNDAALLATSSPTICTRIYRRAPAEANGPSRRDPTVCFRQKPRSGDISSRTACRDRTTLPRARASTAVPLLLSAQRHRPPTCCAGDISQRHEATTAMYYLATSGVTPPQALQLLDGLRLETHTAEGSWRRRQEERFFDEARHGTYAAPWFVRYRSLYPRYLLQRAARG